MKEVASGLWPPIEVEPVTGLFKVFVYKIRDIKFGGMDQFWQRLPDRGYKHLKPIAAT